MSLKSSNSRDTLFQRCKGCNRYYGCDKRPGRIRGDGVPLHLRSTLECPKIIERISNVKLTIEIIAFIGFCIVVLNKFYTSFFTAIALISGAFLSINLFDFVINKIIDLITKLSCNNFTKKEELQENIEKANMGITSELEEFLKDSNNKCAEFKNIQNLTSEKTIFSKKVAKDFKEFVSELEALNEKLSNTPYENFSHLTTLYKIHLPKLLEYTNKYIELQRENLLTEVQIEEYMKLLKVFSVKISNYSKFLTETAEDDFVIKLKALNQDVIPSYDGSEEKN